MIIGLIIIWLIRAPALGLLAYWRTAWYPLIVFPVILSLAIWFVNKKSESDAIWLPVIIHALLLITYFWEPGDIKEITNPMNGSVPQSHKIRVEFAGESRTGTSSHSPNLCKSTRKDNAHENEPRTEK